MGELRICLLSRSGCSACVTPTSLHMKLRKHLKLVAIAHGHTLRLLAAALYLNLVYQDVISA